VPTNPFSGGAFTPFAEHLQSIDDGNGFLTGIFTYDTENIYGVINGITEYRSTGGSLQHTGELDSDNNWVLRTNSDGSFSDLFDFNYLFLPNTDVQVSYSLQFSDNGATAVCRSYAPSEADLLCSGIGSEITAGSWKNVSKETIRGQFVSVVPTAVSAPSTSALMGITLMIFLVIRLKNSAYRRLSIIDNARNKEA
jgi:hypothetical protein